MGAMLMALCLTISFDLAGQISTQMRQPVQSSGATWITIRFPRRSWPVDSFQRNPSGTAISGSKALNRIAAWGQTRAQRPQSMQMSGSQIGISSAMERFSHMAVPVGNAPSTGSADTGSRSPLPASIMAVTRLTNSGAISGTGSEILRGPAASPTATSNKPSIARSTASSFLRTTTSPLLP